MIFRLILVLSIFLLSGCGMSNPFDDNIPYKTRFDDGLSFFEEAKYVKASQLRSFDIFSFFKKG